MKVDVSITSVVYLFAFMLSRFMYIESTVDLCLIGNYRFPTWEGLFWEKASGFEESMKYKS